MKASAFFIIILVLILTGCKTQQTASNLNDDVYYQKSNASKPVTEGTIITEDLSAPKNISTDSAASQKSGSSTFADDYNDYSSRIKRFSHTDKDHGYFDEVYTNSDNYDTTGSNPDVNIYLGNGGYSCWDPSISFGFGFGYGYGSYGYPYGWGWGYPYYGYYYPYYDWYGYWGWPYYYPGNYWTGYYDGYYNGYWDGYYGYPYDPYGYTTDTYYGRRDMNTSGGYSSHESNQRSSDQLANDRSVNSAANERTSFGTVTNDRSVNPASSNVTAAARDTRTAVDNTNKIVPAERSSTILTSVQKEQYRYTRSTKQQNPGYQRNNDLISQREKPAPRYTRPQNTTTQSRTGNSQSYSSPAYRQPKSSQDYINPRRQTSNPSTTARESSNSRSYSNPSNSQKRYNSPSNTTNNSHQYTSPSPGQNRTYTPPSRTNSSSGYSSPSRSSSPSYSAPSRSSSPSYSAPSRSGGSSGGSGGSGSSGGGGGRRK
jgi:hypothetical protein